MKKQIIKGIGLVCLLMTAAIFVNAQSGNSSLVVSKDVQRVANKKAFENNESNIQARSLAFPAIVISKGIARAPQAQTQGNVVSKGYPTWAISKGVARQNQQRILESPAIDNEDKGLPKGEEITRN